MIPLVVSLAAVSTVAVVGGIQSTLPRRLVGFIATVISTVFIPMQTMRLTDYLIGDPAATNLMAGLFIMNLFMGHLPMLIYAGSSFFLGYLIFAWREARKELGR
ncbi:hypothetical protein [uncultured Aliiroseovarius sp.]|uniref:hypothetical protein n=1 Tax=uncultured Aliiroseovarius sp. TaxID=1658783 RepID=UPI00261E03BC|nr:hypothetical protein [uncultured Aliiroseovarius sp.]